MFQRCLLALHQQFQGKIAAATTRSVFIASKNAVNYFHRYEFEDDSFFTLKWNYSDKLEFKPGDVVKFSFTQQEFQGRPQRDIVANSMELIDNGDARRIQSMKTESAHTRLLSQQQEPEEKMATTMNSSTSTTSTHPQASNKEQLKNTNSIFQRYLPGHHQQFHGKIAAATTRSVFIASQNAVKYFHRYEFEDDSFFTLKWQNSDKLEFKPGDVVKFSFTQQEYQGRPQRDIVANSLELIEQGDAQHIQSMKPEATHMEKLKQPSQQQKTEETLLNSSTSTTPANSQASNEEQGMEQSEDPTQLAVEQKIRMEAVTHMVEILKSQSFTPQATRTAAQFVREVIQYASLLEGYIQTGELEQSIDSKTVQLPETTTEQSPILDSEANKNVPTPTPTQEIVVQPSASGVQVQLEVTQKATI